LGKSLGDNALGEEGGSQLKSTRKGKREGGKVRAK